MLDGAFDIKGAVEVISLRIITFRGGLGNAP